MKNGMKIGVAIPCYKERKHILGVLGSLPSFVDRIYVVDDACPDQTGKYVEQNNSDERMVVIYHDKNSGVGGAMVSAYRKGLEEDLDIIVKIDGDGQMDPALIAHFIQPILTGKADYVKGNRFNSLSSVQSMPFVRKCGNSLLSFINKLSSGYWNIMDPTNGYTAIHRQALSFVELDKLAKDYFFESDLLFRLGTVKAVVAEIPMVSKYGDEKSSLSIKKVALTFPRKYFSAFCKRVVYSYYVRDFNIASIEFPLALILMAFGIIFGAVEWVESVSYGEAATTGTVMIAVLPIILGFQLFLSAIHFDINNVPTQSLVSLFGGDEADERLAVH